jgi:guanylate kinase
MSSRRPSVIVVSAPSGAGKTTVLTRLLGEVTGLRFSVSHTTRAPRAGEVDGVAYHFVDRSRFEALVEQRRMLEWAEVHGSLYGTGHSEYERAEREGIDLLLDIDVQGAAQVRKALPDAVTILILPPSYQVLESRLRGRGLDDERVVSQRLAVAAGEAARFPEYDYLLINEEIEACVGDLRAVVRAARCRASRREDEARRVLSTFPVVPNGGR